MQRAKTFAGDLYREWKKDEAMRHAAALAYYTVFSLPAFIMIVLTMAGRVIGDDAVASDVFGKLDLYIGPTVSGLLEETLLHIRQRPVDSWLGTIGILLLVFAAVGVIRELRVALNKILGQVKPPKTSLVVGLWNFLLSLLLLLVTALLLTSSIIAGTTLTLIGQQVSQLVLLPVDLLSMINNLATYLLLTVLFFLLYLLLPVTKYPLPLILIFSAVTSTLLMIGTILFSFFIAHSHLGEAFGVAASAVLLLFWIYYAANIFLFGAELIDITAKMQGFSPAKNRHGWRKMFAKFS